MMRALAWIMELAGQGRLIGLLLLGLLLALRAWDPQPVVAMRFKFFDVFQQLLPRDATDFPVVIVDVDEKSLAQLGQWPWPRASVASLINQLRSDGASAIAFDVVFAEPDRSLSIDTGRLLSLPVADLRAALTDLKTNDRILADSLREGRVVLGQVGLSSQDRPAAPPRDRQTTPALLGGNPRQFLYPYASLLENIPELAAAAAGRGIFSLVPEVDGIVRRVPLVARVGNVAARVDDVIVPSLEVEMLRVATGQTSYAIQLEPLAAGFAAGIAGVKVAGVSIPTDRTGMLYVRYGPHRPERFVSAVDVMAGRVDPARFNGRLVLVGTSAAGLRDLRPTPVSPNMAGVEIHAQLIENILAGTFLTRPAYVIGMELAITCFGGLVLIGMVPLLAARWTAALHLTATALLIGGSLYAFQQHSFLLDWSYPVLSGTAVYLMLLYVKYATTERQKKQVSSIFRQYLSPILVEQLVREPTPPRLGGELRTMTVMFADVRNFTTISERLKDDPQALTGLINRFLTPMTEAVLEQSGTIDKYVGDSLMAFWNAPVNVEGHAIRACAAALAMFKALEKLNQELQSEGPATASLSAAAVEKPGIALGMGVGLSTGECVVGNMGSVHRFNYSVLGDTVNLAARLESLTKLYGVGILVSEATQRLAPQFAALELDLIAVKGKREAVRVYGIVGGPELASDPAFLQLAADHADMLAAYRRQDWPAARTLLRACTADGERLGRLWELYGQRIERFEQSPPGPDWDGVYVAETK